MFDNFRKPFVPSEVEGLAEQQGGGLQFALSEDALVMGAVLPEG